MGSEKEVHLKDLLGKITVIYVYDDIDQAHFLDDSDPDSLKEFYEDDDADTSPAEEMLDYTDEQLKALPKEILQSITNTELLARIAKLDINLLSDKQKKMVRDMYNKPVKVDLSDIEALIKRIRECKSFEFAPRAKNLKFANWLENNNISKDQRIEILKQLTPADYVHSIKSMGDNACITLTHTGDNLLVFRKEEAAAFDRDDNIKVFKDLPIYIKIDVDYNSPNHDTMLLVSFHMSWGASKGHLETLTEATRTQLIAKSKKGKGYRNSSKGNRWVRKNKCSVASSVKDYNKIDMNTFWKQDYLKVGVKVAGETDTYDVEIEFTNVLKNLAEKVKANKNKLDIKLIYDSLLLSLNSSDVKLDCNCDDYKYRFKAWATKNGYNAGAAETRDAKITNPQDNLGAACKHILCVLNNAKWLNEVASVINNYANYCKDNMELNYKKYIFPKIYGMSATQAERIVSNDSDESLPSDEATINLANALGKVRGRIKKGSNKNPVAQKERAAARK